MGEEEDRYSEQPSLDASYAIEEARTGLGTHRDLMEESGTDAGTDAVQASPARPMLDHSMVHAHDEQSLQEARYSPSPDREPLDRFTVPPRSPSLDLSLIDPNLMAPPPPSTNPFYAQTSAADGQDYVLDPPRSTPIHLSHGGGSKRRHSVPLDDSVGISVGGDQEHQEHVLRKVSNMVSETPSKRRRTDLMSSSPQLTAAAPATPAVEVASKTSVRQLVASDNNEDTREDVPRLVPEPIGSPQRIGDADIKLNDDDIEWALRMFVCCRPDARYGDSRAATRPKSSPARTFSPELWAQQIIPSRRSGSDAEDQPDPDSGSPNRLWICLPHHAADHWSAIVAAITQDQTLPLLEGGGSNSMAISSFQPCTGITSVLTLDSMNIKRSGQQILEKVKCLINAQTNGDTVVVPPQDGGSVISQIACAEQSNLSGCGIHVIVNTVRFLAGKSAIDFTTSVPIDECMWRRLLALLCTACQAYNSGLTLSEQLLSNLETSSLLASRQTVCNLTSDELVTANTQLESAQAQHQRLNSMAETSFLDVVAAMKDIQNAIEAQKRALLPIVIDRLPRADSVCQSLEEIHDILQWAENGAKNEWTSLDGETVPLLLQEQKLRQEARKVAERCLPLPLASLHAYLWDQDDAFTRKQLKFYRRRIIEAKRTAIIAKAVRQCVVQRDLERACADREELQTVKESLQGSGN